MPSDLDYFRESALNNSNLRDFCKSLPEHVRRKFKESLNAPDYWVNILHGYRGPSNMCDGCSGDSGILPSKYGIVEIQFKWGVRRWINIFTFWFAKYVQGRLGHLEWSSLYFDSQTGECLSHDKNEASEKLNAKADKLFEEGKYSESLEYSKNAYYTCSSGYMNRQKFKNNMEKAEAEVKALELNSQGEVLFGQENYSEAVDKFTRACNTSKVSTLRQKFGANLEKAQIELDALNLMSEADNLFRQEKYVEAESKCVEAYNLSRVTKQKDMYISKKNQVQAILNKLSTLDTMWTEAWDAENNAENDSDEELAMKKFQVVLEESKCSLTLLPSDSKFKQIKELVTLKIKGNELFNQGLELQQNGISLFQTGQELMQVEKYESARAKLQEAKNFLVDAHKNFDKGSKSDQRFVPCVEIVQEQIDDLIQSLESLEQQILSAKMCSANINIVETSNLDTDAIVLEGMESTSSTYNLQI